MAAPKKGTTRPSGNVAPAPTAKSSPAPIVKDSKGNIDPRYGKKIQQEQGVAKAVQQYSSPIGPKALSNKAQMMQRAQQMRKENEKNKNKGKGGGRGAGSGSVTASTAFTATIPLPDPPGDPSGPSINESSYDFTPKSIKIPDRDAIITLEREGADQALITAVLFEQIGATELVKFIRNDTIDGIDPAYSVISNVADLKTKLDVSYLIAKQRSDTTIDNGFSIRLQDKLPSIDYLFENNIPNYVYFDTTVNSEGSLVIELDNIDIDEIIEVEIDTNGTIVEVRS
jgi:hypothetical protein